jgi:hypothetical protein
MKTWSLLASLAVLLFLAGFSLLGAPSPARTPRSTLEVNDPDSAQAPRLPRRYRQSETTQWRSFVLVR